MSLSTRIAKWSAVAAIALVLLLAACGIEDVNPSKVFVFSFESGTEGWYSNGADLDNPSVDWSINRAVDMSVDSVSSMRIYLDNDNGRAKIWMERMFSVDSAANYRVDVRYQLATRDYGSSGLWTIIAGVGPRAISLTDELVYHDDTANGAGSDVGYLWRYKSYSFDTKSSNAGKLFVNIGIWGTTTGARSYYLDQVLVSFTRR
jgi:hypothetical protein